MRTSFLWLGEQLALDFLNTEPIVRGERMELLGNFAALVSWCKEAELVSAAAATHVVGRWDASRRAKRMLQRARDLRYELRLTLERRLAGRRARASSVDALNACLRIAAPSTQVDLGSGGRFERRILEFTEPEQLLRPIADAAVELLCDVEPALVRRCDNPACVLYFHDVSKNHARRWCSMALCGNRSKVAAHYARQRSTDRRPPSRARGD